MAHGAAGVVGCRPLPFAMMNTTTTENNGAPQLSRALLAEAGRDLFAALFSDALADRVGDELAADFGIWKRGDDARYQIPGGSFMARGLARRLVLVLQRVCHGSQDRPRACQAIVTRIYPGTGKRGAKIRAECVRGVRWKHLDSVPFGADELEAIHVQACAELVCEFLRGDLVNGEPVETNPWSARRSVGVMPDGAYVHVSRVTL